MGGNTATLPAGYSQTSLIKADAVMLTAMTSPHPAVTAMTNNTNIFGLMGHNPVSRTAFVSFRGTSDPAEWVADIDAIPDDYRPISGFGQVHSGFQEVYQLVRKQHRHQFGRRGCRLRSDPDHRPQPRRGTRRSRGA